MHFWAYLLTFLHTWTLGVAYYDVTVTEIVKTYCNTMVGSHFYGLYQLGKNCITRVDIFEKQVKLF